METTQSGRSVDNQLIARLVKIVVLVSLVSVAGVATVAHIRDVVLRFMPDDAFYYLEIARHLGNGEGSTFDGINQTNGYHPLWLLALVPLAPIMNGSREIAARLIMVIGVALTGGAYLFISLTAKRVASSEAWLACLFAASTLTFSSNYGVEAPLAAFLLAILLYALSRISSAARLRDGLHIGILASLLILCRLDSAVYVIAMNILWGLQEIGSGPPQVKRRGWSPLAMCIVLQVVILAPYFLANRVVYGSFLPISALIKAGRGQWLSFAWVHGMMPLVGIASVLLAAIAWKARKTGAGILPLRTAIAGTTLMMVLVVLKGGEETYHWYYALPAMSAGLFVAAIIFAYKKAFRPKRYALWAMMALGMILLAMSVGRRIATPGDFEEYYDRAIWIAHHAPADAVFASPDCGTLGYFSEHAFVNTDGLTNSFSFQEALRRDKLGEWLGEVGVNAIVSPRAQRPDRLEDGTYRLPIPVPPGMSGVRRVMHAIVVPWSNLEDGEPYILWRVVRIVRGGVPERLTSTTTSNAYRL